MAELREGEKMIPMRMIFTAVEVVTFHGDHEAIAAKIAAALPPGSFVRMYEYETEGRSVVRRDELGVIRT